MEEREQELEVLRAIYQQDITGDAIKSVTVKILPTPGAEEEHGKLILEVLFFFN